MIFSNIIFNSYKKESIKYIDLQKDNNKNNIINENKFINKDYSSIIINFIKKIKENIKPEDLNIMVNNMNTLKISFNNFKENSIIYGKLVEGMYIPALNLIEIKHNYCDLTFYHELLHASTTIVTDDGDIISGFYQKTKNGKSEFGKGLNEGYTEYLVKQLFSNNQFDNFSYFTNISKLLEIIISNNVMQSLYFNANLNGLIDILSKYVEEDNVLQFLYSLDYIHKCLYANRNNIVLTYTLNKLFKKINNFLIKTYLSKLLIDYNNKKITKEEFINKMQLYINCVPKFVVVREKKYTNLFNNKDLNIILNELYINDKEKIKTLMS